MTWRASILTLFPEMFPGPLGLSLAGRALAGGLWSLDAQVIRAFVTDRPVRPADVAWTIYDALGIDPTKMIITPGGRPVSILSEGAAVHELFG